MRPSPVPDYRMIEVPHPIEAIPLERVVGYAVEVLQDIVKRLTISRPWS
jgi:hypothetical protein